MENNQSNPSQGVSFIMDTEARKPHNKFGALGSISGMALNPETTGASILAESMITRHVADKRDMEAGIVAAMAEPVAPPQTQSPPVAVAATPAEDPDRKFERQIGIPDFLPAWFFAAGNLRARAVCKIETSGMDYRGDDGMWSGTGFLISPNILLTNHHVLNSKTVASRAICIFNYEVDEFGSVQPTDSYRLDPAKLFITSPVSEGLDFTACWIENAAAEKYGHVPVYRHAFAIKNDDCANIVQHPQGNYKAVVVQHNEVRDQNEIAVLYDCDTEGGSSGAAVYNNAWKLVALHHASKCIVAPDPLKGEKGVYRNEGIKMAAIATYLESLSDTDQGFLAAREVLQAFNGVDSAMGFFGSLGREELDKIPTDLERVTTRYKGEEKDIDICFWNIEWFNNSFRQKLDDVAWEISIQNLDVWVISESSPEAARALVKRLKDKYQLDYDCAYSEPDAPGAKQTTTVLWNTKTVAVTPVPWPEKVQAWLALDSRTIDNLDELQHTLGYADLEKVDGKIFDRYPGRFKVKALLRDAADTDKENGIPPFDFYLVPLHLKAMAEGSKRRQFACRILTQAIKYCLKDDGDPESDWVIGGDLNATLASGDLSELSKGGFIAATAHDAAAQAFTYLKKPYQSLIDHIFLSPNLTERTDSDGIMILARERDTTRDGNPNSDYLSISDHRPIMIRLSLYDKNNVEPTKSQVNQEAISDLFILLSESGNMPRNNAPAPRPVPSASSSSGRSLQDAIIELERARNKTYYDAEGDGLAKKNYYGQMPSGRSSKELFDHFHSLVTHTHQKALPYEPAFYLYPWVDVHQDGQLVSLYNGERTVPEKFIEADFKISESDLEAGQQYNCEHVVPQSWFNKSNPQRGDLHHLFACEPVCNSFRGNKPYTEFADWEEKVKENCGRRETTGFEPKRAKGIVARATLYFMLRYPDSKIQYERISLNTLLSWHIGEPPDEYEFHRNAAIQELQGNRNPFIDFPKLAIMLAWDV